MKFINLRFICCFVQVWAALLLCPAWTAPYFTDGSLIVSRVGDGDTALSSAAARVSLLEMTPDGKATGKVVVLPNALKPNAGGLVDSGKSSTNGHLQLSADGQFLLLTGYDAPIGTESVVGTTATAVHRSIARVDPSGKVWLGASLKDAFSGDNIRSATFALDGSLYTAGNPGVRRVPPSEAVATDSDTVLKSDSYRLVSISRDASLNTFLAVSSSQDIFVFKEFPVNSGDTHKLGLPLSDAQGYVFLDRKPGVGAPHLGGVDTLYVCDAPADKSAGGAAVRKFEWDGKAWTEAGSAVAPVTGQKLFGLCAKTMPSGAVQLFASTAPAEDNAVLTFTDESNGNAFGGIVSGSFALVARAGKNYAFRGLSFAPDTKSAVDLTVTLAAPSSISTGEVFDYQIHAKNLGLFSASEVSLRLKVPAGLSVQGTSAEGFEERRQGNEVFFSQGILSAGTDRLLSVQVCATRDGVFAVAPGDLKIELGGGSVEFEKANNAPSAAVTTTALTCDLALSVNFSAPFSAGGSGQYKILVKNEGTGRSVGAVSVSAKMPAGLRLVSFSGLGWTQVSEPGGGFSASRQDGLNAGALYSELVAQVEVEAASTGTVVPVFSMSGGSDFNLQNNEVSAATEVKPAGPGVVAFATAASTVFEEAGKVRLSLVRTGGKKGAVTVRVATTNGSAVGPADFTPVNAVVTFADGEVSKSVDILIKKDALAERNEDFKVTLSSPTGGATLGMATHTVSILEADGVPPVLSLTGPAAGSVLVGGSVLLSGRVTDNVAVQRVEVSLNNAPFLEAKCVAGTSGTSSDFSTLLYPQAGANSVLVRATDTRGNSASATRSFFREFKKPLKVGVTPLQGGVVSLVPAGSFAALQVGGEYTLSASPKVGFIWSGWSGAELSEEEKESPLLHFTMREGLSVTANFLATPFVEGITGDYEGLVLPAEGVSAGNSSSGFVSLKLGASGGFSGSLKIDGDQLAFAGTLDSSGCARFGAARLKELRVERSEKPPLLVSLALDLAGTRSISGSIAESQPEGSLVRCRFVMERIHFDGVTPARTLPAAVYNFALPSKSQKNGLTRSDFPRGTGFGTISVASSGTGRIAGTLADGTSFSGDCRFTRNKTAAVFISLYGARGQLSGVLKLDETAPDSDVAGESLTWFKPQLNEQHYPLGWPEGITLDLFGTRFKKVSGRSALPDLTVTALQNAGLAFVHGGLSVPVRKALNISVTETITRQPASDKSFSLVINHDTGTFSGDCLLFGAAKTAFSGIILEKGANRTGAGFFLTPTPSPVDGDGKSGEVQLAAKLNAVPSVLISEFMVKNAATQKDDDGNFSDWIELYNPKSTPLDLSGWFLTDESSDLEKWKFPQMILSPKQFLVVWASGKNRRDPQKPLHTSFLLSNADAYLAVVRPDGKTVEHEYGAGVPKLGTDESFGLDFGVVKLVKAGADAKFQAGPSAPAAGWNGTSFNAASWTSVKRAVGFGMNVPGFLVRQVVPSASFGGVGSLSRTQDLLKQGKGSPLVASEATEVRPQLNLVGEGDGGRYGENLPLPILSTEPYAIRATGKLWIPEDSFYTFGLNSDDGGAIFIDGVTVMLDDSNHGPEDHLGAPVFLKAGSHDVEVLMWEGGGGDEVEFFAAKGEHTAWNTEFQLVGASGGIQVSTPPVESAPGQTDVETNVSGIMQGKTASCYLRIPFSVATPAAFEDLRLRIAYSDGFVAYLNGKEVARRNAPLSLAGKPAAMAARNSAQARVPEEIDLSAFLSTLKSGANVLAFVGLNFSQTDDMFLLAPELMAWSRLGDRTLLYGAANGQPSATPGGLNGSNAAAASVAPLVFSSSRGVYSQPFDLSISSPVAGVTIRYTLDGSAPSAAKGEVYKTPLRVSKTTVLRTIAINSDAVPGPVQTQTYLFLEDVIRQSPDGGAPSSKWPEGSVNGQVLNYGMDPRIVNHTDPAVGGARRAKEALEALPSVSIVTDLENLMDPQRGIWVNAGGRGASWERPASVELIGDENSDARGFQINCGIRIRGGYSRSSDNPKHGFKLYFREEYGEKTLKYPLFGGEGATEFDKIELRTAQNYSWSFGGDGNNTFLREESSRLLQGEMGQPYSRVRDYHLYINGQYWGIFNTDERPEATFASTYLGGSKEDYDVVKAEQDSGYVTGITDGNLDAWKLLWQKTKAHALAPTNANFFAIEGKAADGVTSTGDPVLLDVDNFIDYLLLTIWTGNFDGCTSAFLGEEHANNWSGLRNRNGKNGFRFFAHDFEHVMFNVDENRTGPFNPATAGQFENSNPMFMHGDLLANPEYRLRWADRVQKHFFNGGALSAEKVSALLTRRAAIIERAIIAESARWGDSKRGDPLTRLDWVNAKDFLINEYVPNRGGRVLQQLREDNLFPSVAAPELNISGGITPRATELVLQSASGSVYYTLDGSDPRLVGGSLNGAAKKYAGSFSTETPVPAGSAWKYLDDGTNQGVAWRAPLFNDSGWATGNAKLGYGDGDEATVVGFVDADPVAPDVQKNATTYFRKKFLLKNKNNVKTAKLRVRYDDAVLVYLNGVEVLHSPNIASGAAFNTYASGATASESDFFEFAVPSTLFVEGENTLAAEVHQASAGSSDAAFDLELIVSKASASTPLVLTDPGVFVLKSRVLENGSWSALLQQTYDVRDFPNLMVSSIPSGDFVAGGTGSLVLSLSNTGQVSSRGTTSLEGSLPEGLSATGLSGSGWTVFSGSGNAISAQYTGLVAPGASAGPLVLNVRIAKNAPQTLRPSFKVLGGGDLTPVNNVTSAQISVKPTLQGSFYLDAARYVVAETSGRLFLKVFRTGNLSGTASVRIATRQLTALAGVDFNLTDQVLEFGESEASKEIALEVLPDLLDEANETFQVSLSNPSDGVSLGTPAVATVSILSPDVLAPVVSVSSPGGGQHVFSATARISGTVTDSKGVSGVEVQMNQGRYTAVPFTLSADGLSASFEAALPAIAGTNTFVVRAFDYSDNVGVSGVRSFVFHPVRALDLLIVPVGGGVVTASGSSNISALELGKGVSLSVRAASGMSFAGWSVTGFNPYSAYTNPLTFTMSEDVSLVANFVPNPFSAALRGDYSGLLRPVAGVAADNANHGFISINVGNAGAFSARLQLEGETFSAAGTFGPDGIARFGNEAFASVALPRSGRPSLRLSLKINVASSESRTVTGSVGLDLRLGSAPYAVFSAARSFYDGKSPGTSAQETSLQALLPAPSLSAQPAVELPKVSGNATVQVTKAGLGTLAGALPDGTKFTASAPVLKDLSFSAYCALYPGGKGSLSGVVRPKEPSIVAPELQWFRPYISGGSLQYGWPAGVSLKAVRQP